MIICNNCGNRLEEGLRFCSECGAESLSGPPHVPPTQPWQIECDERATSATLQQTAFAGAGSARPVNATHEGAKQRKGHAARSVALTVAIMLILLFAALTVIWLSGARSGTNPSTALRTVASTKETSARLASPAAAPDTSPSRESEVTSTLGGWVGALEAHDLDAHMSYFAETLDTYYSRRDVPAARVRADLERAFSRDSTLSVQLSGMSVTLDQNNESARVTLNKSWISLTDLTPDP